MAEDPAACASRAPSVEAIERDGNDAFKRDYDYYPERAAVGEFATFEGFGD